MSERDHDILEVLLHRVRILALDQLATTWWASSTAPRCNARRWANRLQHARLVRRFDVLAHPLISIEEPVLIWQPGAPRPNFGPVAYRLRTRWKADPICQPVVTATRQAAARLGGHAGRRVRVREGTHELHHAQAYLTMRRQDPERASTWVSESELAATLQGSRPAARGPKRP